jgi:hypothetical protein
MDGGPQHRPTVHDSRQCLCVNKDPAFGGEFQLAFLLLFFFLGLQFSLHQIGIWGHLSETFLLFLLLPLRDLGILLWIFGLPLGLGS